MNQDNDFMAWYDSLSDAEQNEVYRQLCGVAAELGVTVGDEVSDERQAHCDRVAGELLAEVQL